MKLHPRKAPFLAAAAAMVLSSCDQPLDLDMRGMFGDAPSTAEAARAATAPRPAPDSRGIISYPGYQVAVARRGDTLRGLAARIDSDAEELARFNGMEPDDRLREGEIVALYDRVSEPAGGPIQPPDEVDVAALADSAIRSADTPEVTSTPLEPAQRVGEEPVRHKVRRGETAYTIARLYDVSVRNLAQWNGLGSDFAIREGQYLLIPVALADGARAGNDESTRPSARPGAGSPTPTPPSASQPLPETDTAAAAQPVETVAAPDLSGNEAAGSDDARMDFPVRGDIIREYAKGRNDGIDIAAPAGTPVGAAAEGVVAAITEDTNDVPIIVVKHPDNLLTVYSNVGAVSVGKGDTVSRGQKLAEIRRDGTAALHFEVRKGFDSVDPMPYLE